MKNTIYVIVGVLFILLTSIYLFLALGLVKENFVNEKLTLAKQWASEVDITALERLKGVRSDDTLSEYWTLKEQLNTWAESDVKISFTYIMGLRGNTDKEELFFYVDNVPHDDPDVSLPGDVFNEDTDDFLRSVKQGEARVSGPVADRWGVWVSVSVPVYLGSGEIASLGIDYDAVDYNKNILIRLIPHIGVVLLVGLSLFIIGRRFSKLR